LGWSSERLQRVSQAVDAFDNPSDKSQRDSVGIGQLRRRGGLGPKSLVVLHLPVALGLLVLVRFPVNVLLVAVQWHGAFLTEAFSLGLE
jgi:hypothetical protein